MGWTSYSYTESKHLEWTFNQALGFSNLEFYKDNYRILHFWYHKAKTIEEHHELYLVMEHPDGIIFLMVVLVDIIDNEIFFKEITSSMGPSYYNCPVQFLDKLDAASSEFDTKWRNEVKKRNLQYYNQMKYLN